MVEENGRLWVTLCRGVLAIGGEGRCWPRVKLSERPGLQRHAACVEIPGLQQNRFGTTLAHQLRADQEIEARDSSKIGLWRALLERDGP